MTLLEKYWEELTPAHMFVPASVPPIEFGILMFIQGPLREKKSTP